MNSSGGRAFLLPSLRMAAAAKSTLLVPSLSFIWVFFFLSLLMIAPVFEDDLPGFVLNVIQHGKVLGGRTSCHVLVMMHASSSLFILLFSCSRTCSCTFVSCI